MKRNFLLLSGIILLISCNHTPNEPPSAPENGKGGVVYGGVFTVNEVEDFRSLYPLNITEVTGHRIAGQVYEGLLKLDQETLKPVPGLASSWEVNESGTVYTFKIRENVFFHDNPCFENGEGRKISAIDVKYVLDRLCQSSADNVLASFFLGRVKGASDYYHMSMQGKLAEGGVSGIRVLDDFTIEIELEYPFSSFLSILSLPACYVYPREAVEMYGQEMRVKMVGTGPFMAKTVKEGEVVILERNREYWASDEHGNKLPYLDAIKYTFIKEKQMELMEFMKGNLDMVYDLPPEDLARMTNGTALPEASDFELQRVPAMVIQYYGFQHQSNVFNNVEVRKAFNYAIDREQIVQFALQGKGYPAVHGIVPPCFKDYNTGGVKGYSFSPEKAREHMSRAGYPNGEGFPVLTLQLNYGGSVNVLVAEAVQKMLEENLGLNIELTLVPRSQHYERVETGKALFWRDGWSADYADPENFLNLLYGALVPEELDEKSYINSVRYHNPKFDNVFEQAMREQDETRRMKLFQEADQVAMDDAAIIPLYYEESVRLLQKGIVNFPINPLEYRDFTTVWFDKSASAQRS